MNNIAKLKEEFERAEKQWISLEESVWKDCSSKSLIEAQARLRFGYSRLCLNHAISAGRLIKDGYFTSGKALLRPGMDAYGRQLYVNYCLDEEACSKLMHAMLTISMEYKDSEFEKLSKMERVESVRLPYGDTLVRELRKAELPAGVPLYRNYEEVFSNLNSATHGGIGAVMKLFTIKDVISEPEFSIDHVGTQTTLIELRLMSLIALLISEGRSKEATLLQQEHSRITLNTMRLLSDEISNL